ncbi:DcaP family trimeric outer membrane transporter [Desulfurobacterium thermolithotrophum]|uniref:DcaP family trimeric outer membrane transporter n=1 Tax=Desulfurobacterium thermolithotrophum TaxID=64160 RepID=UPI0013D51709|nr:DcaP family trimeric outer membrane transporter [Desulfurobacterium thermolithotrophum]
MKRLLSLTLSILASVPAFAQDRQDDVEVLKEQIRQLQEQMAKLQSKLIELEAQKDVGTKTVTGLKSRIKLYGRIKFDAIYDTHNMGSDQYITTLPKPSSDNPNVREDRTTFNMKDTRIGLIIDGPKTDSWKIVGRVEGEFYGKVPDDNGAFRIRLSYINLNNGRGTNIRIGQDYVPIGRQMTSSLDFMYMASSGNLWDRVAQITVTQNFNSGFGVLGTVYKSAASTDGVKMRMPWVGAKVFYKGYIFGTSKPLFLALGGAYRQGTPKGFESSSDNVNDYLVVAEWNVPFQIGIPINIKGETYVGQGLDTRSYLVFSKSHYIDNGNIKELQTWGGFIQLTMKPVNKFTVNLGAGMDNPDNSDADKAETYEKNWRAFGNVIYSLAPNVSLGAEINHQETLYKGDVEHGNRLMLSAIYSW